MSFSQARTLVAAGLSLSVHALAVFGVPWLGPSLDLDVEFSMPESVEFGIAEATEAFQPPPEPVGDSAAEETAPSTTVDAPEPAAPDPAAAREAARREKARRERLAARRRERRAARQLAREQEEAGATIPPGAQLALRINLAAIRGTVLEEKVRVFLGQVPDWQLVLNGSGIEPVRDLERVLIASPNLRRSRVVIAGRHVHDQAFAAAAVARLAEGKDEDASWSRLGPYPVAPWKNQDHTARVISVLTTQSFVIAREEDLPRVLASALANDRTQARSQLEEDQDSAIEEGLPPTATEPAAPAAPEEDEATSSLLRGLLWMPEGAVMSFAVEGARNYARGQHIPERASLVVKLRPDGNLTVEALFRFETEVQAQAAEPAFERLRQSAQQNLWLAMTGMSTLVSNIQLEQTGASLRANTVARPRQAQVLLALVGARLSEYARQRGDHPGVNAPDPNAPDPNAPDPNAPDPNAPDPNAPDPNAPDPNAPDPNAPDPNAPDPNAPDPNAPDPGSSH